MKFIVYIDTKRSVQAVGPYSSMESAQQTLISDGWSFREDKEHFEMEMSPERTGTAVIIPLQSPDDGLMGDP